MFDICGDIKYKAEDNIDEIYHGFFTLCLDFSLAMHIHTNGFFFRSDNLKVKSRRNVGLHDDDDDDHDLVDGLRLRL
jgi:hypothetical protein